MGKIAARKNANFKAISTAPSFNKTPVGSAIPPLPYPTTQDLVNSASTADSVRFNSDPAYVLDMTKQPSGKGDSPGTAKGIKSGTVNGEVKPTGAASHFKAEGHYVVQQGDTNTMNGGNNPGIYVTTQVLNGAAGGANAALDDGQAAPPVEPQTPDEAAFLDSQGDALASFGPHIHTAKLLLLNAAAKQLGAPLTPSDGFTPGKKG